MKDTALLFIELTEKDLYAVVTNDWIFYGENPIIYIKKEHLTINNGIMQNVGDVKSSIANILSLVDQELVANQILNDGYIIANWDEDYSTVGSNVGCCSLSEYQKLSKFNVKKEEKEGFNSVSNKELNQLRRRVYAIQELLNFNQGNKDYKTEKYYLKKQENA